MVTEPLAKLNPVLHTIGDARSIAKFVLSQLAWSLKCDDTFWYHGQHELVTNIPESMVEGVNRATREICGILNSALDQHCKNTGYNFLSSVEFTSKDGAIHTEIHGVRDVPGKFPVGSIMKAIDELMLTSNNNQSLPSDVAMSIYATRLREQLAATTKVPADASSAPMIKNSSITLPKQSFATEIKVRRSRESIAAVAA